MKDGVTCSPKQKKHSNQTKMCLKNVTSLRVNNLYILELILIILAHHMLKLLTLKRMYNFQHHLSYAAT